MSKMSDSVSIIWREYRNRIPTFCERGSIISSTVSIRWIEHWSKTHTICGKERCQAQWACNEANIETKHIRAVWEGNTKQINIKWGEIQKKHVRPMKKHPAGLASDEKGSGNNRVHPMGKQWSDSVSIRWKLLFKKRHAQAVGEYKVQFGQHEDDRSFKTKDVRSHLGVR